LWLCAFVSLCSNHDPKLRSGYVAHDPKLKLLSIPTSGIVGFVKVENDNRFHLIIETLPVKRLSDVALNEWRRIERLEGPREDCERLLDLGFTPGEEIIVTHAAPLGDPLVIRVRGALLALRRREAAWIFVE